MLTRHKSKRLEIGVTLCLAHNYLVVNNDNKLKKIEEEKTHMYKGACMLK